MGINRSHSSVLRGVRVRLFVIILLSSFFLLCDGSSSSSSSSPKSIADSDEFQEISSKRTRQTVIADKEEIFSAFIAKSRMAHGGGSRGGTRGGELPSTGGGGESPASRTPSTTDTPARTAGAGNEHPHDHGDNGRCLSNRLFLSMSFILLVALHCV